MAVMEPHMEEEVVTVADLKGFLEMLPEDADVFVSVGIDRGITIRNEEGKELAFLSTRPL